MTQLFIRRIIENHFHMNVNQIIRALIQATNNMKTTKWQLKSYIINQIHKTYQNNNNSSKQNLSNDDSERNSINPLKLKHHKFYNKHPQQVRNKKLIIKKNKKLM
jgi:hypothetical protein